MIIYILSLRHAQIAQLVEQWTENPRVTGSIPVLGTFFMPKNSIKRLYVRSAEQSAFGKNDEISGWKQLVLAFILFSCYPKR